MPAAPLVGIRLEDKSRWERRVPIVPAEIARLRSEHGLRFRVQPSPIRIYDDEAFRQAGAEVEADLAPAPVIFSVKEVPIAKLAAGKTYAFFAHVIKGQPHNMPLLQRILDLGITLIDYEKIVDAKGRRLVKFGYEAGQAGMIDTFWALGERLAREGVASPFQAIRQAYRYADLAEVRADFAELAAALRAGGAATSEGPLVVGFTGRGSVSRGAQNIFDLLPHEVIAPEQLPEVMTRGERDRLFKVVFDKAHLAQPLEAGRAFDEAEYASHPERYTGRLPEYLPYLTVLVNGIFWTARFPRFVPRATVDELWRSGERRLRVIGDISCDIDGAVELTYKSTQPDQPTYIYDPVTQRFQDGLDGPGVAILAVDNLPCELPRDASDQFSASLARFLPAIARADYQVPFADLALPPEVLAAVIAHRGQLAPDFEYLSAPLAIHRPHGDHG